MMHSRRKLSRDKPSLLILASDVVRFRPSGRCPFGPTYGSSKLFERSTIRARLVLSKVVDQTGQRPALSLLLPQG
jgi:hypothetical protein